MPNVGDYIEPVIWLGPCHDERQDAGHCGRPPEPVEYTFTYRITRVGARSLRGILITRRRFAVPP